MHEIRVTWGDCDPACIAYTARLPWFALDAINARWEAHLGGDGWYPLELDRNIGTPFVNLNMDFRHPVTPRHRLIYEVWPSRQNKSVTFSVVGRQNGTVCFEGRFTCVFHDRGRIREPSGAAGIARHHRTALEVKNPVEEQRCRSTLLAFYYTCAHDLKSTDP